MHHHDTLRFVPRVTSRIVGPVRQDSARTQLWYRTLAVVVGQTHVTTVVRCHHDGILLHAKDIDGFTDVAAHTEASRLAAPNVAPNREMQLAAAAFRALDNARRGATYQTGPRRGQQIATRR